ncbi:MAG: amino-acid N-acetyltransferase [Frankiaceae bacterium]|nr:amino-acid N-acetyltransferase [Frankiaceae bacterium]MBV9869232.1 amino-acid N-acetyltransferase [Frankiaceae bacterium]
MELVVRSARTADVPLIRRLIDIYAEQRILLDKPTVTLYEDVQEFVVAEVDGVGVGCGALHVLWADLAEVRSVAVDPVCKQKGVGHAILEALLDRARTVGVQRVFCLTFEVNFFERHGFRQITETAVEPGVYEELMRSYDEGVAEFLGLERVKPNILGNTRMLLQL